MAHAALDAIARVVREASYVLGPVVADFERWLAPTCGVSHAVGVASGTDAIELALRALHIGAGHAVVTPAVSFVAAAEAIARVGARPVFCDVRDETMVADSACVEEAVGRALRAGHDVRAVVPVDLFGLCAPVRAEQSYAGRKVSVVEDAAQAIGARDEDGRTAGSRGDAGALSFFPTKNLGAWGDGGAVLTSRAEIAERVRRLRVHGATAPNRHAEIGLNSRLDAVQAAVLLAKTPRLAAWQAARERLAAGYREALAGLPIRVPREPPLPARHAWHAFVVRTDRRDALERWLLEGGIETRVYYPLPLYRQPCFTSLEEPALPVAEEVCRTALALPIFPTMTESEQTQVIERLRAFF